MTFLSSRFPTTIGFGAIGGPGFLTNIGSNQSGIEQRNSLWNRTRHGYEVGQVVRKKSDMQELISFFMVAAGRANAFRFKDFADFTAAGSEGTLGALTGTTWQMVKHYTSGSDTYDRIITRPVSGTITVSGGGVYTIDYTTGIITKVSGASPTGWVGEFDVPCRFNVDEMKHQIIERQGSDLLINWESIPVIEVRGE